MVTRTNDCGGLYIEPPFNNPVYIFIDALIYSFGTQVTVEVLRGDHKEKIPVLLEPKPDES